jgi:type IV secretory pathway TraG/TraD family ATPase VirD4
LQEIGAGKPVNVVVLKVVFPVSSVMSLYIDRLSRLCNRPGRYPCALVCDEFGTVRAYNMATTIATARSNDIVPILAVQDLTQLRLQYSKDEADMMLNISGNLLCGQVGGETARWVSERFPKILQEKTSVSTNSHDTSISQSTQWEPTISPATVAGLSSGEFLGVVADDPGMEMELKGFHAKLVRQEKGGLSGEGKLPIVKVVDRDVVQANFRQVKADIERLVGEKYGEVMKDGK